MQNNDSHDSFKKCEPFSTFKSEINDVLTDKANHTYIATPMNKFYGRNYSDTSGNLWQFKRDESPANNSDFSINNDKFISKTFEYKAVLKGRASDYVHPYSFVKNTKIVVPGKYFSNFRRSLEMPLTNCKAYLESNWILDCISSNDENLQNL